MIYTVNQPLTADPSRLLPALRKKGFRGKAEDFFILRKSLDARKKGDIHFQYTVTDEPPAEYCLPAHGVETLPHRPLIAGAGPAGLFAGLLLARAGFRPLIVERGEPVEARTERVRWFWKTGMLDPESNVCFGEGGAGTFSDGKLSTGIRDREGRIRFILREFADRGADRSILTWYRPHVGSDVLPGVIRGIREEILAAGGEIRFRTKLSDLSVRNGQLTEVTLEENGIRQTVPVSALLLAVGHGARDTMTLLSEHAVPMTAKPFAVGFRIEHSQAMIQRSLYGTEDRTLLPAADYKCTENLPDGRGIYTFCMCPGGFVVNASTETGHMTVNGMSNAARDGENANAAVVVTVGPDDFTGDPVLAGMAFQRKLEARAFEAGKGAIPVQLYGDYRRGVTTTALGEIAPQIRGSWQTANLAGILPDPVREALIRGIDRFGERIEGFSRLDAVLSGVESRTSSPVRILRDERFESTVRGLFPCGEGAGYAGGIVSAAADGMRVAEEIIRRYHP